MKNLLGIAALLLVATVSLSAFAGQGGEDGGGPPHRRPPLPVVIKCALDHKDALALTADQVTKLQNLLDNPPPKPDGPPPPPPKDGGKPDGAKGQDGPPPPPHGKGPGGPLKDILTEDQFTKLKEFMKADHPGGPGGGGPGGGAGGTSGAKKAAK